jgi:putative addiction module component (TIGR02574 family)
MTIAEISQMTIAERLQTMEALWDSLIKDPSSVESPSWHGEILSERREKIISGKADFISIDELKAKHR